MAANMIDSCTYGIRLMPNDLQLNIACYTTCIEGIQEEKEAVVKFKS